MNGPNPNPLTPRRRGLLLAVLMLFLTQACSGIRTDSTSASTADFSAYRSYAWSHRAEPGDQPGQPVDDAALETAVRAVADAAFAARRLERVDRDAAELLLGFTLRVEERVQTNDPYFAIYPAEKFELGHLAIDAVDAKTGERVWRGVGQSRLRYTARSMGVSSARFVPTGEERKWRIDDMVAAVLARFPIR